MHRLYGTDFLEEGGDEEANSIWSRGTKNYALI
jgi:hypothetical protein